MESITKMINKALYKLNNTNDKMWDRIIGTAIIDSMLLI